MSQHFAAEVDAYDQLERSQCPFIPRYYGCYQLYFEDHGLDYDNTVNVVMLEYIKGKKLSDVMKVIDDIHLNQVNTLAQQIYASIDSVHASSVSHGYLIP